VDGNIVAPRACFLDSSRSRPQFEFILPIGSRLYVRWGREIQSEQAIFTPVPDLFAGTFLAKEPP
jgi:hypothetical protein